MQLRLIIFVLVVSPIVASCVPDTRLPVTISSGSRLKIDCSGEQKYSTVLIDAYPIVVLCRTPKDLEILKSLETEVFVSDIEGPYGQFRSVRKDVFIAIGINFHGGCSVEFVARGTKWPESNWLGGFHALCHGEVFDLAGRQLKPGKFSPTKVKKYIGDLVVPRYQFISANEIEFL